MPLGELFSCVWLVLLALHLMTTYPRYSHCGSISKDNYLSSSSSSSSSSLPDQHSATAAAISAHLSCHRTIDTSQLISADCQRLEQTQNEPGMRITGEISEGPGPPSCPKSCSNDGGRNESNRGDRTSSCYRYLAPKDCVDSWLKDWSSIRLRHCCEHSVQEAVPDAEASLNDPLRCEGYVRNLLELDAFVAKVSCQFEQVLLRYDCHENYSVNSCQKCKDAYRRWVCASLIPHWRERHKIKPCRSICHAVEQNCPWFLPADKTPGSAAQYAGEPIFQCIDSNIPETGEQLLRSTYGGGCCYEYCEQRRTNSKLNADYNLRLSRTQIVSCTKGCDNSTNDLSQDSKASLAALCNGANKSTTAPSRSFGNAETKSDPPGKPFVNFSLSSCSSASSSFSSSSSVSSRSNTDVASDSESNKQRSATSTNTPPSLLIYWFLFCLFVTHSKLYYGWR